ncbi:hypothetical protein [Candidatus Protochlamydia amoebophila]|uniref:Uncharacterized protein n=1 Tax=Protochlamydia amoebophila (strain UWE25) TaxID=264201 RepID=Q6MAE5_PARUW|nr:hypothetical protein [Candidatus Protochlamydia amoebophila]CAF24454.1 unnamed protein product [Candidatus Protochlamydia amoebophila UWE25]
MNQLTNPPTNSQGIFPGSPSSPDEIDRVHTIRVIRSNNPRRDEQRRCEDLRRCELEKIKEVLNNLHWAANSTPLSNRTISSETTNYSSSYHTLSYREFSVPEENSSEQTASRNILGTIFSIFQNEQERSVKTNLAQIREDASAWGKFNFLSDDQKSKFKSIYEVIQNKLEEQQTFFKKRFLLKSILLVSIAVTALSILLHKHLYYSLGGVCVGVTTVCGLALEYGRKASFNSIQAKKIQDEIIQLQNNIETSFQQQN